MGMQQAMVKLECPKFQLTIGGLREQCTDDETNQGIVRLPTLDALNLHRLQPRSQGPGNEQKSWLSELLRLKLVDITPRIAEPGTRRVESILRHASQGDQHAILINTLDFPNNFPWNHIIADYFHTHLRRSPTADITLLLLHKAAPQSHPATANLSTHFAELLNPATRAHLVKTMSCPEFVATGSRDILGNLRFDIGGNSHQLLITELSSRTNNPVNDPINIPHHVLDPLGEQPDFMSEAEGLFDSRATTIVSSPPECFQSLPRNRTALQPAVPNTFAIHHASETEAKAYVKMLTTQIQVDPTYRLTVSPGVAFFAPTTGSGTDVTGKLYLSVPFVDVLPAIYEAIGFAHLVPLTRFCVFLRTRPQERERGPPRLSRRACASSTRSCGK